MKKTLLTLSFFSFLINFGYSQYQYNNFEVEENLPITIEPITDTLWQIGTPAKDFFTEANSFPNAIITDSLNTYPTDQSTWFEVAIDETSLWYWPFIQIDWNYKIDTESGVDGGIIEASYDDGQTWKNVFSDPEFQPFVVGDFEIDTLFNGQIGLTGVADWQWMAVCWGTYTGELPENPESIKVRLTFVSDSIDTQQEGWMLDDIQVITQVIGSTSNQTIKPISVFPNPTTDLIFFELEELNEEAITIQIYDNMGQLVRSKELSPFMEQRPFISVKNLRVGNYSVLVRSDDLVFGNRFVKR